MLFAEKSGRHIAAVLRKAWRILSRVPASALEAVDAASQDIGEVAVVGDTSETESILEVFDLGRVVFRNEDAINNLDHELGGADAVWRTELAGWLEVLPVVPDCFLVQS